MPILRRVLSWALVALMCLAFQASAQDNGPDYAAWERLASEVEADLELGQASDLRLENLRSQVAIWRDNFLEASEANAARIETLQSQLDALGPVPEEGQEEASEITQRRKELTDRLAFLSAPVKQADEAYRRANGVIGEIDDIIRARQADALLELGPSPLNPAHWGQAWEDLRSSLSKSWAELERRWASDLLRNKAKTQLPAIILLAALGFVLLTRGRGWARSLARGADKFGRNRRAVWRFLISLGQILLPMAGIYALTQAVLVSGLAGPRWSLFLESLPVWAAVLLGIHWLAEWAFNDDDSIAVMPLAPEERVKARWFSDVLAALYVARGLLEVLIQYDRFSAETLAVIEYPLLLLSGLYLFRLGRVRNDAAMVGSKAAKEGDAGLFRLRFARLLGRAAMVLGVVGPVLAAIGYLRVGSATVYPAIASLAVIGAILVLQSFINDLYALITRQPDDQNENEGLLPVLAGFILTIASLPILALIWGAREADLTELWTRFREGFQIGETRFSPSDFLVVVVVFVLGYMLTRLLQGALRSSVLPRTKIDQGGQTAIVSGIGYIGIFVAAIVAITMGGLDLSSLAIVAGALSVGIGFGLQNIVSNFVSGIILLIERPISEGDWIEVNGVHGTVRDISVRSTRIETFDRYDMIVPNADLVSGTVSNYTRGNVLGRIIVPVGVAYGTDTRRVEKILMNIARDHDMVLMNPAPYVVFRGFGADSLDFEVRMILRDVNKGLSVRTEINHQIAERFTEEGIEIPFAQRDVWLRNPEALTGEANKDEGAPE
ncbi:putative MscS family protein.1 precursor [Pelagimonas phthalicica]|uniref:Putative MscS family protein.1 n=1 Tax=Pelagimonas phthalicica TaxID=1037362 RepID=A0A238JG61_9RHOB|nr:DUF3772 domain-containing protein [Pelagimonas phthalicica]TDS91757.1 small-conductance mechanosensitive channel [Pelagimonas phthalicica]SMX28806.1 putative MscS family protein.1 precursor [Pelagimonas phthalicica]